jgi:hypothetical protein
MKTIYVLLLSFFITLTLSAQHTLHKMWDKKYGGLKSDELYKVIQGNNGGYLLCGYSNSNIGGDKTQNDWNTSGSTTDFWVIQIDSDCNKVWDKRFGGTGYELNVNIIPTNDHGYIIGGPTDSDNSIYYKLLITDIFLQDVQSPVLAAMLVNLIRIPPILIKEIIGS